MRRVAVINQFALPRTQGGGTRHVDLFSRLEGWDPLIIAGNRNHYSQEQFVTSDERFRLLAVPRQDGPASQRLFGWVVFGLKALATTLVAPGLALVYGSSPQPFGALAGLAAAKLRRIPFVLEVRDLWPESIVSAGHLRRSSATYRIFAGVERLLASQAERVVCVTDGWEDHFRALGVGPERLAIVPNGTEPSDFVPAHTRDQLREAYGIHGFTAIFAGAHGSANGLDLILDAAESLRQVNFLFVGSGPCKADAVLRVRRAGMSNVEFRDPVSKRELPGLLAACDLGVHAVSPLAVLEKGMSPNKLFDYMAAGLPVVSNAGLGLRRVVRDDECGRIGQWDELTSCIGSVRGATDEQRAQWAARSLQLVSERHSRAAAAGLLSKVLDTAIGNGGKH